MTESQIQAAIFATLGSRADVRLFRNNVGAGFVGRVLSESVDRIVLANHRRIRFGLHPGSGDLIGWRSMLVTPDLVGHRIAQLLSIEVKSNKGQPSRDQSNWLTQVTAAGGVAGVVRSADEAAELLL